MTVDIAVVGAGLGGLSVAALLARAGKSVRVLDKAKAAGGRASTQALGAGLFNLGPHALYRAGAGHALLQELGVPFNGKVPPGSGSYALCDGALVGLPAGPVSLLTTTLFDLGEKLEVARLLATLGSARVDPWRGRSVEAWVQATSRKARVRAFLRALVRVTTYANAPALQDAGAMLLQLQRALAANVLYLDGGWQSLVEGLLASAREAGVEVTTGARVERVEPEGVRLADGSFLAASTVILAVPPSAAAALYPRAEAAVAGLLPVRAACLDLLLARLPRPEVKFALGIDAPLYLSVHSRAAKVAPEGMHVVELAKYLSPDEAGASAEQELEHACDLWQPGWRAEVLERRFLPELTVSHALVTSRGRPAFDAVPGVYLVGDWVGDEGMLADGAFASAREVAKAVLARPGALGKVA